MNTTISYPPSNVVLGDVTPLSETTSPTAGAMNVATRSDHQHPRLTATANGTLNSQGEATIVFTRTFASKPSVELNYVEAADNQPVVLKIKSWTMSGSDYTGCVIKGYRSQTIPQNLVSLLLGGVVNLFQGSVTGVEYSMIAIQSSSPA